MSPEIATAAASTALPTGTWRVDTAHSSVEFQVKHLGIATVKGQFTEFEGTLEVSPESAVAYGTVQTASVNTREPQRDEHLRSADFFDATQNPVIDFRSTAITPVDEDELEVEGEITIHGVTGPLKLKATIEGTETDPQGNDRVGVSAVGQIDRKDFGMTFNAALGSGNLLVSDKVKIQLEISAVKA
ncbi:MAG: YceI family protein [Solirubrobacteraceae bacterium]